MDKEQDYEQEVLIKIKGYGNREHREKQAAEIKRTLEVRLQTPVEVFARGSRRKWIPVERKDSNAYVSQEEPG